jgi:SagB-type dehydrogenase family enzyme
LIQTFPRRSILKKGFGLLAIIVGALGSWAYLILTDRSRKFSEVSLPTPIRLPDPETKGLVSTEEVLAKRRSVREYSSQPLKLEQLSQLMWAAQGITLPEWGFRTAPSAGGTYPLELYIVVGEGGVSSLDAGIYRYDPKLNTLTSILEGDFRAQLATAALNQRWVAEACVDIVITAVFQRTTERYGERGVRYVHMEAGHSSQNIYLQAVSLGLATVTIGAFDDELVQKLLSLSESHTPLYIQPVAYPKQ